MNAATVLERLSALGVSVRPTDHGTLHLSPASVIPPDLVEMVRQYKPDILVALRTETLPSPAEVADSVDACIRLGQRLKRGEIEAVRCGITGKRCVVCQGVPCLGSTPWTETGRQ